MPHQPTVSVVTVVKNGERYLSEAIESILRQTWKPDQILVVDGHSTDGTAQIAQSYAEVCYLQQNGKGLAQARNTGIECATGEFIAFLDHDDYWSNNKLDIQMNGLISAPECSYSYANVQLFLQPGCKLRAGFHPDLLKQVQIGRTPSTLVARRSLFDQVGQFSAHFSIGCDVEWFARVKDFDVPTIFIPQVLLYKRVHDTNISSNTELNRAELFKVMKQSLDRQRYQQNESCN